MRQGGIPSTELFKVRGDSLLNRLEQSQLGFAIGTIDVGVPTCADDMTLLSSSLYICFGNITLSKIVGSQCVLVLQLLCLAACVLKLFVYVRVCASCVLYVCVALSYFI